MSLTPILGLVAEKVGDVLDEAEKNAAAAAAANGLNGGAVWSDYDVNLTDERMIREAFETFDEDGNGVICVEELQKVLY